MLTLHFPLLLLVSPFFLFMFCLSSRTVLRTLLHHSPCTVPVISDPIMTSRYVDELVQLVLSAFCFMKSVIAGKSNSLMTTSILSQRVVAVFHLPSFYRWSFSVDIHSSVLSLFQFTGQKPWALYIVVISSCLFSSSLSSL